MSNLIDWHVKLYIWVRGDNHDAHKTVSKARLPAAQRASGSWATHKDRRQVIDTTV